MTGKNVRVTIHWERIIFLVLISWCVIIFAVWWFRRPMSYQDFTTHSQSYFAQVADACDALRIQSAPGPAKRQIKGDDPALPLIIRQMKGAFVEIDATHVDITLRDGRAGWGVVWDRNQFDKTLWELTARGADARQVVFSRKKV
jgi:hypothetical protein